MKFLPIISTVVLASLSTAFAITGADIAPAALAGKTLVFEVTNGGSPYATTGTWSGAFAASETGFTATRLTGDFVNVFTTYSATVNSGFTNVSLAKFVEGQKPATLTLYTLSGVGHYEVSISDIFGVSLNGTFTIQTGKVKEPEILVSGAELSGRGELFDDKSTIVIGKNALGDPSVEGIFVIKNIGTSYLKDLQIVLSGRDRKAFTLGKLKKTSLAPGKKVYFYIVYKPNPLKANRARLHILSNDKDESSFDLKLTGLPYPPIPR